MKNTNLLMAILMMMTLVSITACKKKTEETPAAVTCADVPGQITTSTGTSAGNTYNLALGSGSIFFDNRNLTFYASFGNETVDVGDACLASLTTWPGNGTASPITVIVGHSYVAKFKTTVNGVITYAYSRFIVKSYQGGIVTVTYVSHL